MAQKGEAAEFYNLTVEPRYAEYVGKTKNQIPSVVERLGHVFRFDSLSQYDESLALVVQAGLDVASVFARERAEAAAKISGDKQLVKWCARASKEDVAAKLKLVACQYEQASAKGAQASSLEGKKEAIQFYKAVIVGYSEWINLFDPDLIDDFKYFYLRQNTKQHIPGVVIGLVTGGIIALLAWKYLPTECVIIKNGTERAQEAGAAASRAARAPS